MPLARYGVLAGRVVDRRAEGGTDTPHYQIHVHGGDVEFRVAVNVLSKQHPSELLYLADEAFHHPVVQELPGLADGFTLLPSQPGGLALDFIRANLFDRQAMRPVPATAPGPDNDLADKLDHFVERAAADPGSQDLCLGQRWGPEATIRDKVFGFLPGNGVHDIHMNQGNSQQFRRDDGVWQDGGLLLPDPTQDQWVAIFLAFQSQAWHTDDRTGHAIPTPEPGRRGPRTTPRESWRRWPTRPARRPRPRPSPWSTPARRRLTWPAGRSLIGRSVGWSWTLARWRPGTRSGSRSVPRSRWATGVG
jgi:uncharacterized protein YukJ